MVWLKGMGGSVRVSASVLTRARRLPAFFFVLWVETMPFVPFVARIAENVGEVDTANSVRRTAQPAGAADSGVSF
jgi:hypothetical protein